MASVWAALACFLAGASLSAQRPGLGTITFPNSGAATAQAPFIRGVLLLHSFEYQDAAQAFREAQRIDPGFALAYWGEALTYTHPLWDEQDRNAARAALQRLGPTPAARRAKAPTPREKEYLDAVETLYGDGSKAERDSAYSLAMERVMARFPADREAKVFYALSLLGLNQGVRDVPTYLRAAAIVDTVFRENPNHPGAAHLLIHSYDDPIHAPLGLAAARDHAAWTPHHYTQWLGYGYLQQGRYADAFRHLQRMHENMNQSRRGRAVVAQMRAEYVVNTEQWDSPCLQWSIDLSTVRSRDAAVDGFVGALSALKRGDRADAGRRLVDLATLNRNRAPPEAGQERDRVPDILEQELRALLRQADGDLTGAVALTREATALEDAMPLEFGPPAVVKPSHELLGEILLQAGRPAAAQA